MVLHVHREHSVILRALGLHFILLLVSQETREKRWGGQERKGEKKGKETGEEGRGTGEKLEGKGGGVKGRCFPEVCPMLCDVVFVQ